MNEEKLFAVIGKKGYVLTSVLLNMSFPTLKKKIVKPKDFKQSEIDKIEELHYELFGN